MGILNTDKTLPSNKLIFELRRDLFLQERFKADMEAVLNEYGLSEVEKDAWRTINLKRLSELGVHPYFLPQITRIFKGGRDNHNNSDAARLYAEKMQLL